MLNSARTIIGILVKGSCFDSEERGKNIGAYKAIKLVTRCLGITKEDVTKKYDKAFTVKLDWIKLVCNGQATWDSTKDELDQCARGYLLYLLTCVILLAKIKMKVYIYYLGA